MRRAIVFWIGITLAGIGSTQAAGLQSSQPASSPATQYRAVLDRYCVTCHNERLKTAGLMLDQMDITNIPAGAETWEKVIRKLRTAAMPPVGMPRPDPATYDGFASYLETTLDSAAAANPNPGRPTVSRLNRAEYVNSVRDLLAIDPTAIDIPSFLPADDSGFGFDNIGDVLSVSPVLLERYMSVAQRLRRLAIGDPTIRPESKTYSVPTLLMQDDRMSEDLPFGSRGGIAIDHHFALDGEYEIKIILQRDPDNFVKGLSEARQLDIRVNGERVKVFTVGGVHLGRSETAFTTYGDDPQTQYERNADEGLVVRFPAKAGTQVVAATFLKETSLPEGPWRPPQTGMGAAAKYKDYTQGEPAVASVVVSGPFDSTGPGQTSSRERIFVCQPTGPQDEEACAKKILTNLARRAYRRPATEREMRTLLTFYDQGKTQGGGFEAGIGTALRRVLVSPSFLFHVEMDPNNAAPGSAYPISDFELASRISFFLWSSIPDDQLLEAAERGRLRDPAVLEQQVRRMLADPRSDALVNNFAGQWLFLRNIPAASPDPETFPDFEENLREALLQETTLFFASTVRENRSVLALLDADYTFLNERLARHYGVPNVYGSHFRRVKVADENRRGLLGQGSVLLVTSYATRTSPTLRGKFILENILGAPLPPPPANVPALEDRDASGKILSVREVLEKHRANPVCASCHSRMDPLGFALDNFDAIGQWRDTESGTPIDASGVLPDGTKFQGVQELRTLLLRNPEQFAMTVTEKLLTYGLGRGVEYYDQPAVRRIVRQAAPDNYRWTSIIAGIIKSTPFQMRRSGQP